MATFYLMWISCFIMIVIGAITWTKDLVIAGMIGNMIFVAASVILEKINELKEE